MVSIHVSLSYKDSYGFVKHGALVCERTSRQKLRERDDGEWHLDEECAKDPSTDAHIDDKYAKEMTANLHLDENYVK